MLRRLWALLWAAPAPPSPRMRDVLLRLDELEAEQIGLRRKLDRVQGFVTGAMRKDKPSEDAPGTTIADNPSLDHPPLIRTRTIPMRSW